MVLRYSIVSSLALQTRAVVLHGYSDSLIRRRIFAAPSSDAGSLFPLIIGSVGVVLSSLPVYFLPSHASGKHSQTLGGKLHTISHISVMTYVWILISFDIGTCSSLVLHSALE